MLGGQIVDTTTSLSSCHREQTPVDSVSEREAHHPCPTVAANKQELFHPLRRLYNVQLKEPGPFSSRFRSSLASAAPPPNPDSDLSLSRMLHINHPQAEKDKDRGCSC